MKKFFIFSFFMVLFVGCGKSYVDVQTGNSATLQLIPKSKTILFKDDFSVDLYDYKKLITQQGCIDNNIYGGYWAVPFHTEVTAKGNGKKGESYLGELKTDSDTPSKVIRIPASKPLRLVGSYIDTSNNKAYIEYTDIVFVPKRNKHYVLMYIKKKLSIFRSVSDFKLLEERDGKYIPVNSVRNFDIEKVCKKYAETK